MKFFAAALFLLPCSMAFVVQSPKTGMAPLNSFTYGGNQNGAPNGGPPNGGTNGDANKPPPGAGQVKPNGVPAYAVSTRDRAMPGPKPPIETAPGQPLDTRASKNVWETDNVILVQGGSLRTWSTPAAERIQVLLKTEGRPMNANVELWHGPDNTPQKMGIYIEDGSIRPFSAVIQTPRGHNAVAIRNTGQMEFPLTACIIDDADRELAELTDRPKEMKTIQGGAIHTYSFDPSVSSVQVLLETDGRPLNARIELLQGPNNNKQVIEIYTEDGMERPFFAVIETPGTGNVVRVVNTATVEFPMVAAVEPHFVDPTGGGSNQRGWDNGANFLPLSGGARRNRF